MILRYNHKAYIKIINQNNKQFKAIYVEKGTFHKIPLTNKINKMFNATIQSNF